LYRYHIPDPVYFRNDIRVTIQQIGLIQADDPLYKTGAPIYQAGPGLVQREKGSFGLFERQDDWSTVAYFYLDKPDDDLPPIAPAEQRMKGLAWGGPYFSDVR
jgi:D-arabinan exo alpha-(1,3)/(1,5)-arabinofuranosidase (non-reducing end)